MVKTIRKRCFVVSLLGGMACQSSGENSVDSESQCNGLEVLCDRRVDEVAFAGTHNSMSSTEDGWMFPNHDFNFERQLDDGIRALNIDTHWWNDEAYLCHTYCDLGAMTLLEGFNRIGDWLADHPREVLIITLQSAVDADNTMAVLESSSLSGLLYEHELGSEWPTLETLIDLNQRILLFSNQDGGQHVGYMEQWTHWIDNPYSAQGVEDFSCVLDRGNVETATLFNINHFITNPVADIEDADIANQYDILKAHVEKCRQETDYFPNQILVDFYSKGSVLDVVYEINAGL